MEASAVITLILSIAYIAVIVSTVILILTENSNSSKTISWLLILMLIPAIGLIIYYIFGYNPRRTGEWQKNFNKYREELISQMPEEVRERFGNIDYISEVKPDFYNLANLFEQSSESRVYHGSEVEVITSGGRKLEALIQDMENAQHHIHFEYFYFRRDETSRKVREVLMRKASEGVKVRFIYENIANIDISPRYYNKMRKAGVEVRPFTKSSLPWIRRNLNSRDHRKIVVIDGKIGYTGGMNIGDDYFIKWRDTHLRIRGQAVYGLQLTFLQAWYDSRGGVPENLDLYFPETETYSNNLMQVVSEAPDSKWPFLLMATVNVVENAKRYIYIQTPYYMPSDSLLQALKSTALSGVDVRIMVSHKSDIIFMDPVTQSYYQESLEAGIRIYELHGKFSHAKSMVVDDYVSVIGSANMDARSLELSFEINTYMYDTEMARLNYDIFFEDLMQCKEILLEDWVKRPWWKKLFLSIMRLFAPLL